MKGTEKIMEQSDNLYRSLTKDINKDIASDEIQGIVQKIVAMIQEHATPELQESKPWDIIIETYSNDYVKTRTDAQYGPGASDYIVKAFKYYAAKQ